MTTTEINTKLEELYADKKARNFFNHLVRGYFPVNKVEKVFTKPRGPFKCVITNEVLISTSEILAGIHTKEFEDDFQGHLKTMFDATTSAEHPMTKLIGDRKMAVSTEDTNTHMAFSTFQVFYDFIVTKMLMGDKHINWLLKDITRDSFMGRAETIQNPLLQKKVKNVKKTQTKNATFTLGDAGGALQALKAKMEGK
jgi:hypothetical protein